MLTRSMYQSRSRFCNISGIGIAVVFTTAELDLAVYDDRDCKARTFTRRPLRNENAYRTIHTHVHVHLCRNPIVGKNGKYIFKSESNQGCRQSSVGTGRLIASHLYTFLPKWSGRLIYSSANSALPLAHPFRTQCKCCESAQRRPML